MTVLSRVVERLRPEAEKSQMGSRHAAAILYGGRIVSMGFNNVNQKSKTTACVSCHAELDAWRSLCGGRKDRYMQQQQE